MGVIKQMKKVTLDYGMSKEVWERLKSGEWIITASPDRDDVGSKMDNSSFITYFEDFKQKIEAIPVLKLCRSYSVQ